MALGRVLGEGAGEGSAAAAGLPADVVKEASAPRGSSVLRGKSPW